ncbi:uncharacterized protein [Hetaerina americana]|uniref:uncharacterized protein n=1 Tax=Hetaerina americana TaxID=62018 RepID=UPI003A7F5422
MAALPVSRTPRVSPVHHCPNRRCSGEMGRRMARAAAMLSLCSTLVGVASAGVYVFPAASVVGADGTKRAGSSRVREVPFLYGGDPADAMRTGGQLVDKRASNLGSRVFMGSRLRHKKMNTITQGARSNTTILEKNPARVQSDHRPEIRRNKNENGIEQGNGQVERWKRI